MKTTVLLKLATRLARTLVVSASFMSIMLMTSQNASALNLVLNFGPNLGSTIQFNGTSSSFQFNDGDNGYQWNISSESVGDNNALGLNGSVLDGPFSYGTIATSGLLQTATVLGPLGQLVIYDGTTSLTGTVNWIDISTYGSAGGFVNADVMINLTGVAYSGSNSDLQTLAANQPGSMVVSFQFSPGETLTQLSTGTGPYSTSYSGSVSVVVPEPTTFALAGLGGLSLLLLRRQRK